MHSLLKPISVLIVYILLVNKVIYIYIYALLLLGSVLRFPALVSPNLWKPVGILETDYKQFYMCYMCLYVCTYMCLYVCACKCGYILYVCVCMFVCICVCVYIYICICMCMYIYMHIHIYIFFYCLNFKLLLCSSFAGIF